MDAWEADRKILLAVTGLAPQVVTETVFALAVGAERPWIPTEVRIVTTAQGAVLARRHLAADGDAGADGNRLARLCADYALPPIDLRGEHIEVIRDQQGQPLDDIRTPDDNEAAADLITDRVRSAQEKSHGRLWGGRVRGTGPARSSISSIRIPTRLSHSGLSPRPVWQSAEGAEAQAALPSVRRLCSRLRPRAGVPCVAPASSPDCVRRGRSDDAVSGRGGQRYDQGRSAKRLTIGKSYD
ncbi:CRISPR-associated ring nuclease Csm6 [uncultured Thiohalocapsa sp.]|uniref:CRISPR-associated ring nuclease Csm6 n=1 Tax=uncultured Thiohalocapsa sp. TaxID=768990 RepID=UPI0025FDEBA2|nr:CRISPR-associated ring nuclease Csm6 [uncultured Thiohalocapsa sp.]